MENKKIYGLLNKTSEEICKKAFKDQYEKFFNKKKRNPMKTLTQQGFKFCVPPEAEYIVKEMLQQALRGEITEEQAKGYRSMCFKLDLI